MMTEAGQETGLQPTTVASNGIEIAYETFGAPSGRPLLLIIGLSFQMLAWHHGLSSRRGGRVVIPALGSTTVATRSAYAAWPETRMRLSPFPPADYEEAGHQPRTYRQGSIKL